MIPRRFQYLAPSTINEALTLLKKYGSDAKVLAGGMSLVPIMKLRLTSPTYVVDINRLSLEYIRVTKNVILIGALTRHHTLETSRPIRQKLPIVAETASWIGDPQVRNMGSIGGSLSHCDPSGDWGATCLALRAEMRIKGLNRERILHADDFFVDTFTSALRLGELLTEIRIPIPPTRSGGAYMKLERKAGDFATVGVAAQISIDPKSVCKYVGIGLTALGDTNLRAKKAESVLLGKVIDDKKIEEAADAVVDDAQPIQDPLRGSVEYREEMARVFTRRALKLALTRARVGK